LVEIKADFDSVDFAPRKMDGMRGDEDEARLDNVAIIVSS
jgi:hypothetical protein